MLFISSLLLENLSLVASFSGLMAPFFSFPRWISVLFIQPNLGPLTLLWYILGNWLNMFRTFSWEITAYQCHCGHGCLHLSPTFYGKVIQKCLACQCYRRAIHVRDKSGRHECAFLCIMCAQSVDTMLHVIIQCPSNVVLWFLCRKSYEECGTEQTINWIHSDNTPTPFIPGRVRQFFCVLSPYGKR